MGNHRGRERRRPLRRAPAAMVQLAVLLPCARAAHGARSGPDDYAGAASGASCAMREGGGRLGVSLVPWSCVQRAGAPHVTREVTCASPTALA